LVSWYLFFARFSGSYYFFLFPFSLCLLSSGRTGYADAPEVTFSFFLFPYACSPPVAPAMPDAPEVTFSFFLFPYACSPPVAPATPGAPEVTFSFLLSPFFLCLLSSGRTGYAGCTGGYFLLSSYACSPPVAPAAPMHRRLLYRFIQTIDFGIRRSAGWVVSRLFRA